ncbi:MAG: hypothetical protein MUO72_15765 [Bacteroidales bacterium]|nr:hypothetical protein [Bacteroidales bacterium]
MKTSKEKQIQEVLNTTFKRANDKSRICCVPGCNKPAINSHILQKNGILNGIAQNRHIIISTTDFFEADIFHFRRKGINESFTFKGFCSEHDKSIFSPIEDYEIDFEDYKSQLLFAYRTVLNERVKKEVILDWHKYQKESKVLSGEIDTKLLDESDEQERLGIKDISYFQDKIEKDLKNNTESFVFKFRYTKPVEICIASHFTFETTRERNNEIQKTGKDFDLLTDIFLSFFPIEGENVLLIGYLKEQESKCGNFVQTFLDCTEDELFKKISDLILCRCEVWACSENFYSNYIKPREGQINKIFQESAESIDEDRSLNFNIFIK